MTRLGAVPRGARELLVGAPLQVKLDRSLAAAEVHAGLAEMLPGLAAELAEASTVADPRRRWQLLSALGRTDLVPERGDSCDEIEGRPNGALRVVFGCGGRSPHGHHRVADELLHRPTVELD